MKLVVVLIVVLFCCSFVAADFVWRQHFLNTSAPTPAPRYHHSFSLFGNTTGVLVGGFDFDDGGLWLNDTWLFHFHNETWTQLNHTTNISRAYFTAHTHGGELIIFGGAGPKSVTYGDVLRYSLRHNNWTTDTFVNLTFGLSLLLARQYHASAIIGNKLYVFGGHNMYYGRTTNDLLEYDLNTTVWKILVGDRSPGPQARQGHSLTAYNDPSYGPSLIVFGGYCDQPWNDGYNDAWQYVISKQSWVPLSTESPPQPRFGFTSQLIQHNLWVYGGMTTVNITKPPPSDIYYSDVWTLQLSGGGVSKWVKVLESSDPGPRQGHQSVSLNGALYSVGGYVQFQGLTNDIWSLHQVANKKQ